MEMDFSKGLVFAVGFLSSCSLGFLPLLHATFIIPCFSSWIFMIYTKFFTEVSWVTMGGECRCVIVYSQLKIFNRDFQSIPCIYCTLDMLFVIHFISCFSLSSFISLSRPIIVLFLLSCSEYSRLSQHIIADS